MIPTTPAASGPPLAAGGAISPHLATLLGVGFLLMLFVAVAIWAVAWVQHGALRRRVAALEAAFREESQRGERIENVLADLKAGMKHQQGLMNIIVSEHMRVGRG